MKRRLLDNQRSHPLVVRRENAAITHELLFCSYLFEVRGGLDLPDRLHEGVPHDDADVRPGVAGGLLAQGDVVRLRQGAGGGAQMQLEHEGAGVRLGQRDVDPLLKPEEKQKTKSETSQRSEVETEEDV